MAGQGTVLACIDRAAAASPRSPAVAGPGGALTYLQLVERADRLAHQLRTGGVGPGDLVGLCLDRSAALVAGALGIVRTGAAYVAIDPRYPTERVRWMLDDARAAALVTGADLAPELTASADRPAVVVGPAGTTTDDGAVADGGGASGHASHPAATVTPDAAAYVVYTSGSTGQPKGVVTRHDALANLVAWHLDAFGVTAADRCSQIASPGFDASVWEIWPTLAAGASLHIAPDTLRSDPAALRDWLVAERITVSFVPTALVEGLLDLDWPADTALRHLLTGGDALTRRPRPGLPFSLTNNYGLSETAVVATSGVVTPDGDGAPSIGAPITGVIAEVVDDELEPTPDGEGELVLGGVAVAAGYLHRDELTTQRFVDTPRGRRYRTGDRVRRRADGAFDFLGRTDEQLSIRGFRVEPGEVAAAINAHPAVMASVAVGHGTSSADRRLIAYAVAIDGRAPPDTELARFLAARLPEHMVPSQFVWLDALPVTRHGKIDRDALPAPDAAPAAGRGPQTPVEREIAAMICELLGLQDIGMDENFFLRGGHSMLGAQLIARLEDRYGVELSLRHLFDHPTTAAIAEEVERQTVPVADAC